MARETLPTALKLMFGHEGGYSNRATDSGGATKYGVTHKTLAAHRGLPDTTPDQVKALTLDEATKIYQTGYWAQSGGDLLPKGLDYAVFDGGVMSGPTRAVKILQKVLGIAQDGSVGPETIAHVNVYPGGVMGLIHDYCAARMDFLRSIKGKQGFSANGRGWTIRVTGKDPKGEWADVPGVIGNALELSSGYPSDLPIPTPAPVPAGGDAKAIPAAANAWLKPETVLQAVPAVGGLAFLATGSGPVQWAVGGVLVLGAIVATTLIVRRIWRTPV